MKYMAPTLAGGAFTEPLKQAYANMSTGKLFIRVGKFITANSGTEWTQRDRYELGLTDDPRCQLCLSFGGTLEHRMLGCSIRMQRGHPRAGPAAPIRQAGALVACGAREYAGAGGHPPRGARTD